MISKNMVRAMEEKMLEGVKHEYGWIIKREWDYDGREFIEGDSESDIGTIGPSNIPSDLKDAFQRGKIPSGSKKFRMLTDDLDDPDCNNGLVYEGLFWQAEDNEEDMSFRPLDDFGEPNYGCCHIQYFENGKWEML